MGVGGVIGYTKPEEAWNFSYVFSFKGTLFTQDVYGRSAISNRQMLHNIILFCWLAHVSMLPHLLHPKSVHLQR
jgi:hypothetical protein